MYLMLSNNFDDRTNTNLIDEFYKKDLVKLTKIFLFTRPNKFVQMNEMNRGFIYQPKLFLEITKYSYQNEFVESPKIVFWVHLINNNKN